ncbi:hypothetical protein NCG89_00355 [Spongiibacter taiwanensis]|uniref:type IV pilus assembly protein FimV n=1 Tax=Spongiibacter taiwanensis TaxID=1748242 RepID=UPI00203614FF|nr:hypothetical protein [Spongiibacter taiwanensis]USA43256.1 hypothetical protein NCG89_00355 [Spongiibacter taiwanensis]
MDRITASSVALLTCGLLSAPLASALGVGTASMESKLGEPLRVKIPIYGAQGLSTEQVLVRLNPAWDSSSESAMGGVNVSGLTVESQIDENGQGQIWLTGKENAQEPFVNFSVELRWPSGALTREYTLLLDLPGLVSISPPPQKRPESPRRETPSVLPSPTRRTPTPERSAFVATTENYRTRRGDSLWAIASRLRQSRGGNINTLMEQIFAANPDAFVGGKPSLLKEAVSLDLRPSSLNAATLPEQGQRADAAGAANVAVATAAAPTATQSQQAAEENRADGSPSIVGAGAEQPERIAEPFSITADAVGSESAAEVQMLQQNLALMSEDMAAMRAELQAVRDELAQVRAEKLALESRAVVQGQEEAEASLPEAPLAPQVKADNGTGFSGWLLGLGASVAVALLLLLLRRQRKEPEQDAPLPASAPVESDNFDEVFMDIGNLPKGAAPEGAAQATSSATEAEVPSQEEAVFDLDFGEVEDVAVSLPDLGDTSELSTQLSLLEFYAQLGDSPAFESLLAQIDQAALSPENLDVIKQAAESLEQQKQLRA